MSQPKVSFQNKIVSLQAMDLTFDQMGLIEEMLNDQVIIFTCDKVNPVAAQSVSDIGTLLGLDIDPNPDDAKEMAALEAESATEELYQIAEAVQ